MHLDCRVLVVNTVLFVCCWRKGKWIEEPGKIYPKTNYSHQPPSPLSSKECPDECLHRFLNNWQIKGLKAGIFVLLGLFHWTYVRVYGTFVMIVISALSACLNDFVRGNEDKMSRSYDHQWLKTNITELSQK